jgi:hypothetical protein
MGCPTSITIRAPGDPAPGGNGSQCGPQGYQGPRGYQGYQGFQGLQGVPGRDGQDGNTGGPGPQGPTGTGSQGPQGVSGSGGSQGPQGGVGVGATYTNPSPTPATVGGIPAGSTFSAQTLQNMFDMLLYPYQSPAFTSFNMSGQATTVEVGTTVSGSKTFTWSTSNSANVQANSLSVRDATANTTLGSGLANSGSFTVNVGTIQKTSQASNTWSIAGTNTQSVNFSANFSVSWNWRFYYGTSTNTSLAASDIQALAGNLLTTGYSRTYPYPGGGFKYLCYPSSISAAVSFKDASNNLNVAMADSTDDAAFSNTANGVSYALVSVTNSLSQTTNYRVYRTKNVLGGSINIVVA